MGFESNTGLGVQAHYGVRTTNQKFGGQVPNSIIKTVQWTFDYNDLPTGASNNLGYSIPAYSKILSARFEVLTAFAGGTSYAVGLEQAGGTDIDADGLLTDATLPTASINARGAIVLGTGALIGASIGAAAGELMVTATGTYTAGQARVVVEYITEGV